MNRLEWLKGLRNQSIINACINVKGPKVETPKASETKVMESRGGPDSLQGRKFKLSDLSIREDEETKDICIFIEESKEICERTYRHTLTSISDPDKQIVYVFEVSPSGLHGRRKYMDSADEERYGKIFSNHCIEMQLFGEEFGEKTFTFEELIALQDKINEGKNKAKYMHVEEIKYSNSYAGKRLLENLHLATESSFVNLSDKTGIIKSDFICLENESLAIYLDKENNLHVIDSESGDEEITKPGETRSKVILSGYDIAHSSRSLFDMGGFTAEAFKKIIETKNKEKDGNEVGY